MSDSDTTAIDTSKLPDDVRKVLEENDAIIAQLREQITTGRKGKKSGDGGKSLHDRLTHALTREAKGNNKNAVKIMNEGFEIGTDREIKPDALLDTFATALEANLGVTVDRSKLKMGPGFVQYILALYNALEVRELSAREKGTDGNGASAPADGDGEEHVDGHEDDDEDDD